MMEEHRFDSVYAETLDFLYTQLPMFQRIGAAAYKADLTTTQSLCALIGNPEQRLRSVHVAGTNGKGSVAHMMASVLQESGLRTGLFTSPHLRDFRERIRVNGQMISKEAVVTFVETYRHRWSHLKPSFFEITFAMAIWYFEREKIDCMVVETGMGGRLDSTNVVRPEVSVITTIGLDHTQFLGDTIAKIAAEKAGIIKPGKPVVLGALTEEARHVVLERAELQKSAVIESTAYTEPLAETDLKGSFQRENVRTAMCALDVLRTRGFDLSSEAIARGLSKVMANTGLLGRWQVLRYKPLTIADCAHNEQGLRVVLDELLNHDFHNLHIVLGVSGDKDLAPVLALFPKEATYYFAAAKVPRAMPAEELHQLAASHGLRGEYYASVMKAFEAARLYAAANDLIFIGGSVFVVAEVV